MKIPTLAALLGLFLGGPALAAEPAPAPYEAVMESDPGLPTHTVYRPADMAAVGGAKLPIVAWANGACANEGDAFAKFLTEIAGHGYLVVAIGPIVGPKPPNAGPPPRPDLNAPPKTTSSQLIDAIDWAIAENGRPASRYKDRLDVRKIAVMGMSCGGNLALEAARDPRVKTLGMWNSGVWISGEMRTADGTLLVATTKADLEHVHSPTLYINGDKLDPAMVNAADDFKRLHQVPVFFGSRHNAGHAGTYSNANGGEFANVAVAWLRWQLKADKEASKVFTGPACSLCKDPNWTVQRKGW